MMKNVSQKSFPFLAAGDRDLLRTVFEFRIVDLQLLSRLLKRSYDTIKRRVRKLALHRYLQIITSINFAKHSIAIGPAALQYLLEEDLLRDDSVLQRPREKELTPFFINHELAISRVHAVFQLASTLQTIQLDAWAQGSCLWDSVTDSRSDTVLPVRPDAYFVLKDRARPDGRNRIDLFLELDRGSVSHTRFKRKLGAYDRYLRQDRHKAKYGIDRFRVITVATSRQRAFNLCKTAAHLYPGNRIFLFTSLENFDLEQPERAFDSICITPKDFHDRYESLFHRKPDFSNKFQLQQALALMLRQPLNAWRPLLIPFTPTSEQGR